MHYSAVGSAVAALIGLVVVFGWLPRHSAPIAETPVAEPRELAEAV